MDVGFFGVFYKYFGWVSCGDGFEDKAISFDLHRNPPIKVLYLVMIQLTLRSRESLVQLVLIRSKRRLLSCARSPKVCLRRAPDF